MTSKNIPGTNAYDLSTLGNSGTPKQPHRQGVTRNGQAPEALRGPAANDNPFGHDILEVTPEEMIRIEAVELELNKHFAANYTGRTFSDDDPTMLDEFERVARDKFGAVGFVVKVEWSAYEADGLPGRAYLPGVQFLARTEYVETDHEAIADQVRAGLADGVAGVIREDGTWNEDARRKQL